jgi:hypothetical protein
VVELKRYCLFKNCSTKLPSAQPTRHLGMDFAQSAKANLSAADVEAG